MKKKGFTLIELIAVIAVIAVLSVMVLPSIIDIFNNNKDTITQIQENEILDSAKMYVEDYCNNPMNSDYKQDCNANFKIIDENTRYVCISHLQSKNLVDNVYYEDTTCNGLVVFNKDDMDVFSNGKTYLYCGSDYRTDGKDYSSYCN